VKRPELDALVGRYRLGADAADSLAGLLEALAAEPDPPTTIRDPEEALAAHVADSLTGLDVPELRGASRIADLGSGAGFPGLVLAIALPQTRIDLIESTARKCAVIERLAAGAGVANARPVRARAEEWAAGEGREAYEAATARALAPLPTALEYAAPLLRPGGALVAWHGARDADEERSARAAGEQLGFGPERVEMATPFRGAHSRHLYVYRKIGVTPPRFPRRPGAARKRPLA
jgi:16S rRNA (guanine527-N7)-methyltransferase